MQHNGKTIKIIYRPLSSYFGGATMECDNYYLVVINSTKDESTQNHAIGHELAHIMLDHFDNGKPIAEVEKEADERATEFYRLYSSSIPVNT